MQYIMANGALVRVLIHTNVTKYLMFKAVDGSYVYNKGKVFLCCRVWPMLSLLHIPFLYKKLNVEPNLNFVVMLMHQIHKVPATDMEALKSPLMGFFEKRRARTFFSYVHNYNESDPKTHEGIDLTRVTTRELFVYASLPKTLH